MSKPKTDYDPFGECAPTIAHAPVQVLGGRFQFTANSRHLLQLVDRAYGGLPKHRLSADLPRFNVRLVLTNGGNSPYRGEPPVLRTVAGAGLICGTIDAASFAILSPTSRSGIIAISRELLRFPYHARYELLEFAVFTLAARAQQLVSLHAACVGHRGQGLLLMGPSGAGKSTIALQCLLHGLDFVSEDSTFVSPNRLLATGVANYVHVRPDSLRFLDNCVETAWIRKSPRIRRRSGVEKLEIDLRRAAWRLARMPLRTKSIVFLAKRSHERGPLLLPILSSDAHARLEACQPYAVRQEGWKSFIRKWPRLTFWELRRGRHPSEAASALQRLLST